jgi:hypothetical protein
VVGAFPLNLCVFGDKLSAMNEAKFKSLDYLQATISRMAQNSFMIKGWSVTLVSALVALSASGSNKTYVLIAYFPCFVFWMLDGYFLSQERKFRDLYDLVRAKSENDIDFSMSMRFPGSSGQFFS